MNNSHTTHTITATDDGSPTLYVAALDEHYHSTKGALTEALHVYIDCGLKHRAAMLQASRPLRIVEIGLGTGLNAALTAMATSETLDVHYFGIEKYPVAPELIASLDYGRYADADIVDGIHRAPWGTDVAVLPHFRLHKMEGDLRQLALPPQIDVVYFDAFAPEKQPEMWDETIFRRIYEALAPHGVLTTYCAKGCIRRLLQSVGLDVERLAGPEGGKREILRGTKKSE